MEFRKRHDTKKAFPLEQGGVDMKALGNVQAGDGARVAAMSTSARYELGSKPFIHKGEDYSQMSNLKLYNLAENSKDPDVSYHARDVLSLRRTGHIKNPNTAMYAEQDKALFHAFGDKALSLLPKGSQLHYLPDFNKVSIVLPLTKSAAAAPKYHELVEEKVLTPIINQKGRKMVAVTVDMPTFVEFLRTGCIMHGVFNLRYMLG